MRHPCYLLRHPWWQCALTLAGLGVLFGAFEDERPVILMEVKLTVAQCLSDGFTDGEPCPLGGLDFVIVPGVPGVKPQRQVQVLRSARAALHIDPEQRRFRQRLLGEHGFELIGCFLGHFDSYGPID